MSKFRHGQMVKLPLLAGVLLACVPAAQAQSVQQQDEEDESAIIVTGSVIRQGGAQDVEHFRSMAVSMPTLPRPESLTLEGLMGEHDLTLPASKACDQLFCLVGHSMEARLPTRPDDRLFVGLGFASNIDGEAWRRQPMSIMAIVDRSGSMTGEPIETVKASLRQMVEELGPQDRLGITIYGTTSLVHLQPLSADGNKQHMLDAINSIAIDGSTNLESGLKLGYDAALAEADKFDGKVRMMLFTDEQPNTGRTDPAGFMGLAEDASRHGIGMTTIGVGVRYDGALATRISSVRGGNLFFVESENSGKDLFKKEFRNMVSEVAHDVTITMMPRSGYSITGVFGVPDGLMTEGKDGAVSVTVPTAFLSSNGGGIFASLGKSSDRTKLPTKNIFDGQPLLEVDLSYVRATDGRQGHDNIVVAVPDTKPATQLVLAQHLVDEYMVLDAATKSFHQGGNAKAAFTMLDGLQSRLKGSGMPGLDKERELVGEMRQKAALFAGYSGEVPANLRPTQVIGKWQVLSYQGVSDLSRGDIVEFTDDEEFITYFRKPGKLGAELSQGYQINEKQLYIPDGDLMVNYRVSGDKIYLTSKDGQVRIVMRRAALDEVS